MLSPLDCRQRWRMPFNPKRAFNIEVAGIATIVLSVAVLAVALLSAW
jgi:lipopolysaccharide/colanic/teichoic acid biosynthesis glycosyltransferase